MYPYRTRIKEPNLEKLMDRLLKDRTLTVGCNKNDIRKLGYKLKPIRQDIFIGFDSKTYESNISIKNPFLKMEKKGKDYIFKI